ncbi:MAG: RimK family alpha-L-glutamate ligase [Bacillota bacterium]|jgi:RimK family alpha-L-glutamate ligase|nr:RimK family alpha-L-glutamate ligase [Bacillota bacterium]HHU43254.1 RimK family alpha-L-glutamate ligase [Clostridiales bacterium]
MKGIVIRNGFYNSSSYTHQVGRIVEELVKRGQDIEVVKNSEAYGIKENYGADFAVFLDKDIYLARILEQAGMIVFNNSFAIENCDDKILTSINLSRNSEIYLPKTLIAPLMYERQEIQDEYLQSIEKAIGYPMVAKKAKGSLGESVYLIENREQLEKVQPSLLGEPHLYQVFVEESRGKSVRVIVVGGEVIASMMLTNENGDFRSNAQPSKAEKVELDEEYLKSAKMVAESLDLDYCGIDFFVGAAMVIEVNSNAFFQKMEAVTNKNIAGAYAGYMVEYLKEFER